MVQLSLSLLPAAVPTLPLPEVHCRLNTKLGEGRACVGRVEKAEPSPHSPPLRESAEPMAHGMDGPAYKIQQPRCRLGPYDCRNISMWSLPRVMPGNAGPGQLLCSLWLEPQDRLYGEGASMNIWPAQVIHNPGKTL